MTQAIYLNTLTVNHLGASERKGHRRLANTPACFMFSLITFVQTDDTLFLQVIDIWNIIKTMRWKYPPPSISHAALKQLTFKTIA